MKRMILIPLACLMLAACGDDEHPAYVRPPADKLVCQDEPGRPGVVGQPVTDDEAAQYMVKLRSSGQSCRDDVNWMRTWAASLNKK